MSDKDYQKPPESERISATQLLQRIADSAIEEAKKTAEQARKQNEPKRKEYQDFMERRFTEADRVQLCARAERAANQRQYEVEILRFPSEFLEDHG
jgi:predicted ATPase